MFNAVSQHVRAPQGIVQIHYVVVNVRSGLGSRVAQDQLLDVSLEHAEKALRRRVVSAVAGTPPPQPCTSTAQQSMSSLLSQATEMPG